MRMKVNFDDRTAFKFIVEAQPGLGQAEHRSILITAFNTTVGSATVSTRCSA